MARRPHNAARRSSRKALSRTCRLSSEIAGACPEQGDINNFRARTAAFARAEKLSFPHLSAAHWGARGSIGAELRFQNTLPAPPGEQSDLCDKIRIRCPPTPAAKVNGDTERPGKGHDKTRPRAYVTRRSVVFRTLLSTPSATTAENFYSPQRRSSVGAHYANARGRGVDSSAVIKRPHIDADVIKDPDTKATPA